MSSLFADAQHEMMQGAAKDGIGAVVERLEQQYVATRLTNTVGPRARSSGSCGGSRRPEALLCLSGGGAIVLPGCCVETLEDPWEMVHPVRRGEAGVEGVLEAAVETFHIPLDCRCYAVVWLCWMLSKLNRAAHRKEVNWVPRSDVMTASTSNLLTHP